MLFRRIVVTWMVLLAGIGAAEPAAAAGVARVEQSDGVVREYHVFLHVIDHRAVRITSADRRGTLTVEKGACSYAGELERCLPYNVVLDQFGKRRTIVMQHGTEYLNRTGEAQQLPFSSHHVPAHGIELLIVTARGTYITVRGTVDGFIR